MDKKDNSQGHDVGMKDSDQGRRYNQENLKEQYKREGSCASTGKK